MSPLKKPICETSPAHAFGSLTKGAEPERATTPRNCLFSEIMNAESMAAAVKLAITRNGYDVLQTQ